MTLTTKNSYQEVYQTNIYKVQKLLIDTDVILDFLFDRKPYSDHASQLLSLCESEKIMGFVTPVICSNVYYILRQTAPHDKVIEKLKQLLMILNVLAMDGEVVHEALNSGFKDFEDALQNAAAIRVKHINTILTRNIKDYKKSKLGIMTPEDFMKQWNQ
jgi:predicted nucleic acid-binding protein